MYIFAQIVQPFYAILYHLVLVFFAAELRGIDPERLKRGKVNEYTITTSGRRVRSPVPTRQKHIHAPCTAARFLRNVQANPFRGRTRLSRGYAFLKANVF